MERIVELIAAGSRFLVSSGGKADGDAVGSALALVGALRERGRRAIYVCDGPLPYNLSFLAGSDLRLDNAQGLDAMGPFDACFVCDTPNFASLPAGVRALGEALGPIVNIDHHASNEGYGAYQLIDAKAAAAGVMVWRLLETLQHPISVQVANCLYTSILTDTGSFRYNSTDPEAMSICGELIGRGVQPWEMASRIYETQPEARVRLLGSALSTLELEQGGRYATLTVRQETLRLCGATEAMLDGFVNHARAVDGVEVAALFVELPEGGFQVSFRSRGNLPLDEVGVSLGGKGTRNAASARLTGDVGTVKDLAAKAIDVLLAKSQDAVA